MKEYSAEQIEALILRVTDGFFEATDIGSSDVDLHVTVRIATEFRDFLERYDEQPSASEISYVSGTIRSGIDHFVLFGFSCRVFQGLEESWIPQDPLPIGFAETKSAYLRYFDVLCREESGPVERLGSLLSLIRIQLAFLAYYFPWGKTPPARR